MSVAGEGSAEENGTSVPAPVSQEEARRAGVFTVWSWLMLPGFLVSGVVGGLIGRMVGLGLGVEATQSYAEAGAAGWVAVLVSVLTAVLPLALGAMLARRAVRAGAGRGARAALIANLGLAALVLVMALSRQLAG